MKTLIFFRNKDPDEVIQDDCVKILNVTDVIEHSCDQGAGHGSKARLCINYFMQVCIIVFVYVQRELVTVVASCSLCEADASLLSCSWVPCLCPVSYPHA